MRILYLIGNGFDLAQGIKTRYCDFYAAKVQTLLADETIVGKLRNSIKKDTETWADMEIGLGHFTS